ncbi:LysE family translocator [Streptomyces sp. NPDC093568]|uniref:LysE family translocator n=1 Tax=Streptomyces sp. NPDC093568 TaxID=3366041 RepID=UPI00382B40FB
MVPTDRLLAFTAMSFLLIVIPGPSVLFVIGRALAQGRRAALTTVVGNTLGAYVLVVAVACGVGSVVERSSVVFTSLKLVGAAYLVYLGVKALRERRSLHAAFIDSVWGLAAATARDWFARSPRRLAAIGGVGGFTMIGLGITAAATGRKD